MSRDRYRIAAILPREWEWGGQLLLGAMDYARGHRSVRCLDVPFSASAPARLRLGRPLPFDAALVWANRDASWVRRLLAEGVPVVAASGEWSGEVPWVSYDNSLVVRA
ncbi:MAG: hypothetical protein KDN05_10400, partial [Verrucomicrobiae bacterium]|nr:hypothetical protein [Verrucomicrobiae bacterium]